jgi:two-component system copper resistance phosphate regulon response regulator CusR
MRILVAEHDPALGEFLQREFEAEQSTVDLVMNGEEAKRLILESTYDAAILDFNLPRPDGLDVLREIRARRERLPILVLTIRTKPEDHAQMLDLGADDFVLKPFAFAELSARMRALLRRGVYHAEAVLRLDDLELNRMAHSVTRGGRKIELTPREFALLEYLMRHGGERVSRTQIAQDVWNLPFEMTTNVVDVYINYLRMKVDASFDCKLIHTVRGVGYRMQAMSQTSPLIS